MTGGFSNDFIAASGFGNQASDVVMLLLDDIIIKEQVRKKFVGIEELAQNILTAGEIYNDLVVYKTSDGFVLNQGERRYRAAKLLVEQGHDEFRSVPCKIVEFESDEDAFHAQFAENVQREDLDAFELAEAIKFHHDNFDSKRGWQTRLGEKRGHARQFISRHYALLSIDPKIKDLFDKGLIESPRSMLQIDKHDHTDKVCAAIIKGEQLSDALNIGQPKPENKKNIGDDDKPEPASKKPADKKPSDPDLFPKFTTKNVKTLVEYLMDKENLDDYDAVLDYLNNQNK